jgi:uncharacterized membrane protein
VAEKSAPESEAPSNALSGARIQRTGSIGVWYEVFRHRALAPTSLPGRRKLAWIIVLLAIVLFTILVGTHTLVRQQSYHTDAFDLGNMDQAVWNTLHGHPFRFTNRGADWEGPPTRLGVHVEPILLLVALFYLIHSGPETLLILQTIALALGAVPLFLLGQRRLPELPLTAAAIACAYLLSPLLLGEALWDFHPVALATPLLLLALWALDSRQYTLFAIAAVLAALTKEDVALALIPLGLYIAFWRGKPRFGGAVALLATAWVLVCFLVILPHFNGGASGGNNYWYRYAWAGASPGDALKNLATHPWLLITFVLGSLPRRGYIAMVLRTGGGLGIFAPVVLISALPELAVNLYSSHPEQYSGFFQYNAVILAFFFAACVYGVAELVHVVDRRQAPAYPTTAVVAAEDGEQNIRQVIARIGAGSQAVLQRIPIQAAWIGPLVIVWLAITCYWSLASADQRLVNFWNVGAGSVPYQSRLDDLLARIPASASVAATDTLDPHLSDRYSLYLLPDPQSFQAQYVAFNIPQAVQTSQVQDQLIYNEMISSGRYQIVGTVGYKTGTVVVLHRTGPPINPAILK